MIQLHQKPRGRLYSTSSTNQSASAKWFSDYQQPAFDQNAWYNGVTTFDGSGTFIGSSLMVIPNSSIEAGAPNITIFPGLFPEEIAFEQEGFAAPADNFDANPQFGYFVWIIYDAPASNSGNTVQLYRIINAGSNTPTLGPLMIINQYLNLLYNGLLSHHKGNLMGAPGLLQNATGDINPYIVVRNHQMYLAFDIQTDIAGNASITGDRVAVRWYQFDLTGDPTGQGLGTETASTVPVLIQSGTLFDDAAISPIFYYFGAIMVNKQNDLVISFCSSGDNDFVNAGYAFRAASDPLGTLREPILTTNSQFPLNFNGNLSLLPGPNCQRWGDQSTVVTDPDNDLIFWMNQPYAALQNAWGIQATQLIPAT